MAVELLEETDTRRTVTTHVTTWEQRRAPVWLRLLPLLLLGALVVVGLTSQRTAIEADLEQRTRAALADAGVDVLDLEVDASGRDLSLLGTVPAGTSVEDVLVTARGVEGVRVVSAAIGVGEEQAAPEVAAEVAPPVPTSLVLTGDGDVVVLAGTVASEAERAALLTQLGATLGPAVELVDELQVDAGRGSLGEAQVLLEGGLAVEGAPAAVTDAVLAAVPDGEVQGVITFLGTDVAVGEPVEEPVDEPDTAAPDPELLEAGFGDGTELEPWVTTFESGSAEVVDDTGSVAEAREVLPTLTASTVVRVVGHTDTVGSIEDNLLLARERAEAVVALLREVAPGLTFVVDAKGEDAPTGAFDTSRRVDFWLDLD